MIFSSCLSPLRRCYLHYTAPRKKVKNKALFFTVSFVRRYAFEKAATVVDEKNKPSRRRARTVGL
jgi:hypothetical protein